MQEYSKHKWSRDTSMDDTQPRAKYASFVFVFVMVAVLATVAQAAETDQFMTWTIELKDCAEPFNAYLNKEMSAYLDRVNRRTPKVTSAAEIVNGFYLYFFQGLYHSRVRHWLWNSPDVDRYPPNSVSFFQYQQTSIYKIPAFPFILPMARTIRIGDVYLGIDKISHFFGAGRRYFENYLMFLQQGFSEEEAMDRMLRMAVLQENSVLGGLTDGIFSHADMEANFQGFCLARDLALGPKPLLIEENGRWRLTEPLDIRRYVNPYFDESYNLNHYRFSRRWKVAKIVAERYCALKDAENVRARFAAYEKYPPSFSYLWLQEFFRQRGEKEVVERSLDRLCAEGRERREKEPTHSAAPMAWSHAHKGGDFRTR
jgi:hypothetical protein